VVGPDGPVPGALVVALAPAPRERLSLALPQNGRPVGGGWFCNRILAAMSLLDLAAELRGKQLPLARATTDAQGSFRLEGLERVELSARDRVTVDFTGQSEGAALEVFVPERNIEVHLIPARTS
jgi:hypothetical protein